MLNRVLKHTNAHTDKLVISRNVKVIKGPVMPAIEEFHAKGVIAIKTLIENYASDSYLKKKKGHSDWSRRDLTEVFE